MADTAMMTNEAAEEERLMLDAIEKWLEQKVRPGRDGAGTRQRISDGPGRGYERTRPVRGLDRA